MKLKDKILVITGASSGFGRAIAKEMLKNGAKIYGLSRHKGENLGENFKWINTDITNNESIKNAVAEVQKTDKTIDILINNAGIWHKSGSLEGITDEKIEEVINVNLKGLILVTKAFLPILNKEEGCLFNIASQSGVRAMEGQSVYCASKFGVKGFTDVLKLDLKDTNIKVVGFYPSGMNTKMFEKGGETFNSDKFMKVEDIAEIVIFMVTRPKNICMEEVWIKKFD